MANKITMALQCHVADLRATTDFGNSDAPPVERVDAFTVLDIEFHLLHGLPDLSDHLGSALFRSRKELGW